MAIALQWREFENLLAAFGVSFAGHVRLAVVPRCNAAFTSLLCGTAFRCSHRLPEIFKNREIG